MRQNYWAQRSHTIGTAELSSEIVSKLMTKCREHNVTINSLLLSSLLKDAHEFDAGLIDSMYFNLFEDYDSKPAKKLRKILGYTEIPFGLATTNLGKTDLSVKDGIKSAYFIPPLVANTEKIVGIITTDSGLRIVYQYSDQANAEKNKRIFEGWISKLQAI